MIESRAGAERPPAEVYEELFVPALFGPWGEVVAARAQVREEHHVLDVACGTGALTRAVAARVGPAGSASGVDANEQMLEVARRVVAAPVAWTVGQAEALPFSDARFDRVVSQFGMMFFVDPRRALQEMQRVLRPGGRLTVAVCDAIDHSPGYAVLTELLHRLFGADVADAFRAPFSLGDRAALNALSAEAGLGGARVERHEGTVRFASIAALVSAERACAWTLGGLLDEDQFARLLSAAEESLAPFVVEGGPISFGMPALLLVADKPA